MTRRTLPIRTRTRSGFNLLEVTVSTLLVGILLTGSMTTVAALIGRHGRRASDEVRVALAHDLMSEILQAAFTDADDVAASWGPEPAESTSSRSDFDDIDDYDGWGESVIQGKDGMPLGGYDGYHRSVTVHPVSILDPAVVSPVATDLNRIMVEVIGPNGQSTSLVALRGRHSPFDVEPGIQSTYVRAVGLRLEMEDASSSVHSATGVLNQMPVEQSP